MRAPLPLVLPLLTLTPFTLTACLGSSPNEVEAFGSDQAALITPNGLTQNGLTQNGLTQNGLTQNGLTQNGLTQNSLLRDALASASTGELNQQFLSYVVSCALRADQSVDLTVGGTPMRFAGQMGLAPEWGASDTAQCGPECQQWVSACLLARINYYGHRIDVSLRGQKAPALSTDQAELSAFPRAEATYFGNIFVQGTPQPRYACTVAGSPLISRVCGPADSSGKYPGCVVNVLGDCNAVCDIKPTLGTTYFANCHPAGQPAYRSITVFRLPSDEDSAVE